MRGIRKQWLLWPLILMLTFAVGASRVSAQYGVSPQIVRLSASPGKVVKFSVTCNNGTTDKVGVNAKARYVGTNDSGMPMPSNEAQKRSCVDWLVLEPDVFSLGPGQAKDVQCRLSVPSEGVVGGYYAYIGFLFRPPTPPTVKEGATIVMQFRANCIVMLTVAGASLKSQVDVAGLDLWLDEVKTNKGGFRGDNRAWKARVDLMNTGNVHVSSGVHVAIFEEAGKLVDSADCQAGTGLVLPGTQRSFEATGSSGLRDGIYVCSVEAGTGVGTGAVRSVSFAVLQGKIMKGEPTPAIRAILDATVPGFAPLTLAIEEEVPRHGKRTKLVELRNLTTEEIEVEGRVLGMTQESDGSFDYTDLSRGVKFTPAEGMIEIAPTSLTIAPGHKGKFKVRLKMPRQAAGEYCGAIVFSRKGTTPVLSPVLLGPVSTRVNLTAKGTERRGMKLTKFEAARKADGPYDLKVWVKNEGNCRAGIVGTIEIKDDEGTAVSPKIELGGKGTVLYPDVEAYLVAEWSAKPTPGQYKAIVALNPEDDAMSATGEFAFKVGR
ncbi:MAG: hypothetical protein JW759_05955 [Candidatus Coatesbacteria bacterium]|nr:hypothetical protein [Candidatus Coatesbacteria bacterium]